MKFNLLSIGQKFKFQDEVYVKTSPLVASNVETGHNKMIPRYAVLTLLDDAGSNEQQVKNESINTKDVLAEFNTFYEKCISILENKKMLLPELKNELDQARDEFVTHITQ